jgi:hypothetical protein
MDLILLSKSGTIDRNRVLSKKWKRKERSFLFSIMNHTMEPQIDHDALFKELLHQLLEAFLRLFFPEQAAQLDFRTMKFLEQEFFTDFPSGEHRYIDTLVEIYTLSGELILIHLEFQSTHPSDFPRRMFRYFSQLRLRRDNLIWEIVLYLPRSGCGGVGFETYQETLFGETFLPFRYWCISLAELNAGEYLAKGNPVAYGLVPLMQRGELSNPRLKAICLQGIADSDITEAQAALLAYFVETYLPLDEAEEEEYQSLVEHEEVQVMEFITSWERKGIAKGELTARRKILIRQLGVKFGDVPETTAEQVENISSEEQLDGLLEQILAANSLAEMGLDGASQQPQGGSENG